MRGVDAIVRRARGIRISDTMGDMRISGCLMTLVLLNRLRRDGEGFLGRKRREIGMRRGTKDAMTECISSGWSDRTAKLCGKEGGRARDWRLYYPQENSISSTNQRDRYLQSDSQDPELSV